jgi:hypothetical protein
MSRLTSIFFLFCFCNSNPYISNMTSQKCPDFPKNVLLQSLNIIDSATIDSGYRIYENGDYESKTSILASWMPGKKLSTIQLNKLVSLIEKTPFQELNGFHYLKTKRPESGQVLTTWIQVAESENVWSVGIEPNTRIPEIELFNEQLSGIFSTTD